MFSQINIFIPSPNYIFQDTERSRYISSRLCCNYRVSFICEYEIYMLALFIFNHLQ